MLQNIGYFYIDGVHFFSGDQFIPGVLSAHKDFKTAYFEAHQQVKKVLRMNYGLEVEWPILVLHKIKPTHRVKKPLSNA